MSTETTEIKPETASAPPNFSFDDLRVAGLSGIIGRVLATSDLTTGEAEIVRQSVSAGPAFLRGLSVRLDQWVSGAAIPAAEIEADVARAGRQAKVILRAIEAIEAVVRANPGRLSHVADRTPQGSTFRRTF